MVGWNKIFATFALAAIVLAFAAPALAQGMPTASPTMRPTMTPGMQGMASPTMAPGARGGTMQSVPMTTSDKDVMMTIMDTGDLSMALSDVTAVGMSSTLMNGKDITMFIPDNAAMQKIDKNKMDAFMKDRPTAMNAMRGLIVNGVVMPSDMTDGKTLTMMNGQTMKVSMANGQVMIDGAPVSKAVKTSNGMLYVLSSIPSSTMSMMQTGASQTAAAPASM